MHGQTGPARGLRFALLTLTAAIAVSAIASEPAEARYRRYHRHYAAPTQSANYAAVVIDANSGKELHAVNADALRHPASLTKIMTLYLLFEQLEAGRLKLDSEMRVSAHASDQAPTRLGLDEGEMLKVEDAIKGLVTRSANDAAVVIAETIAGDEESFAKLMTRKARALGMSRTTYRNASGLPDDDQVTTARDQALLGRAIQDRFPEYYRYFQTRSFVFQGQFMGNHNRLLGNVNGVDGIKTGYTRASGFNLVTSVHRGNRFLVAVVLGGVTAGVRDAKMRQLVEKYVGEGATVRTAAKIVEAPETRVASVEPKPQVPVAPRQAETVVAAQAPATSQTIQPVRVKTISVKAGPTTIPALMALAAPEPQATVSPSQFAVTRRDDAPAVVAPVAPAEEAPAAPAAPATYQTASAASTPVPPPAAPAAATPAIPRGAWIIQVGAFPEEGKAKERLREAATVGKAVVANANPFTEKVVKGRQELYRARFAGFDQDAAEAACKLFKRKDIACISMKN
jgi:D-alanyl-D-alanine carboxypeptidase